MKALTMRRLSKSTRSVQRMGSGSTVRSTSSAATDERAAAAALAVKAADCSNHKQQVCGDSEPNLAPLPSLVQLAPAGDDGRSDTTDQRGADGGDTSVHSTAPDQIKGTEQVIRQVSRLQKQLADMAAQDAKRQNGLYGVQRSAVSDGSMRKTDQLGSFTGLGFGPAQSNMQPSPLSAVSAVVADAAADADAVMLDVGTADADQHKEVPVGCWFHWRWVLQALVRLCVPASLASTVETTSI